MAGTTKETMTTYTPVDCVIDAYDVSHVGHINKCEEPQGSRGITKNPAFYEWLDRANSQLGAANHLFYLKGSAGYKRAFVFDATGVKELAVIIATYSTSGKALENWVKIDAKLTWTDKVTEVKTITKERQVPCQLPYQVEKQRVVIKTKKVPIWELIFGK